MAPADAPPPLPACAPPSPQVGAIPQSCIPTGPLSTPDQRANELSPADLQVLERAFQVGAGLGVAAGLGEGGGGVGGQRATPR